MMLDPLLLGKYIESFYGYGNCKGQYWFIGMEEAGAETVEDNFARVDVWDRRGRREVDDLVEYHLAFGFLGRFLGEDPVVQKTWGRLIRILLAAGARERGISEDWITGDAVKAYQRDQLGRATGETCLLELLPLGSKTSGGWMWTDNPPLKALRSRDAYQERYGKLRAEHIAAMIKEHEPPVVVFYSLTGWFRQWWEHIAKVRFHEVSTEAGLLFYLGDNSRTVFAITRHPADRRATNDYFQFIGRTIAAKRKAMRSPSPGVAAPTGGVPARTAPVSAPNPKSMPMSAFNLGETVRHPHFREGQVVDVSPSGDDQVVTVRFEAAGTKKLSAKMSKMERI